MNFNNKLTKLLNIDFPIIMAPMFLVSNQAMIEEGINSGVMATFPTLNYRNNNELDSFLDSLNNFKNGKTGSYGVNLIVQKSNPLYVKHLAICVAKKVPFYITSLGSPKEVIEKAHAYGAKVFCDVTNLEHAQKCFDLGCDGFIGVGQGAGGHAGPNPLQVLIPVLKKAFPDMPIIGAGGIASGQGLVSIMVLGAVGASIGTRFIATTEAGVNKEYKNAIVDAKMDDIVMTTKLSGTPCTIINTPYAKKIGYEQNWIQKQLSKNKTTKKYFKMLIQLKGFKTLENAALKGSYKTLWCAGKSVDLIYDIESVKTIINTIKTEATTAYKDLQSNLD